MNTISWIFVVVFGVAFTVVATIAICKNAYARKAAVIMEKACNFSEEERETYKKMLADNSQSLGVNIFELFDDE